MDTNNMYYYYGVLATLQYGTIQSLTRTLAIIRRRSTDSYVCCHSPKNERVMVCKSKEWQKNKSNNTTNNKP